MNVWQTIIAVLGGGGVAGFLGSLFTGLMQRPKVRADAVAMLTDSALKQVNELQERTSEAEQRASAAHREATAARDETAQLRVQVRLLTAEIDAAVSKLRAWQAAILSPAADLDSLRSMARSERLNGSTHS